MFESLGNMFDTQEDENLVRKCTLNHKFGML